MMLTTSDGGARMTAPDGAIVWVYCGPVAHLQPLPGGRLALVTLRTGLRGVVSRRWLRQGGAGPADVPQQLPGEAGAA